MIGTPELWTVRHAILEAHCAITIRRRDGTHETTGRDYMRGDARGRGKLWAANNNGWSGSAVRRGKGAPYGVGRGAGRLVPGENSFERHMRHTKHVVHVEWWWRCRRRAVFPNRIIRTEFFTKVYGDRALAESCFKNGSVRASKSPRETKAIPFTVIVLL